MPHVTGAVGRGGSGVGAGEAYLAVTVLLWGTAFPAVKPVLEVMDPWTFTVLRTGLACALLAAILRLTGGRFFVPRSDLLPMAGLALLGVTYFQGMWSVGLSLTSASKAAIIMATTPIWGTLMATATGERLRAAGWAGVAVAFAGVFLIVNNSVTALTVGGDAALGDLVILVNAFVFALYTVAGRPLVMRHGALKTIVWTLGLGTLFALPLGAAGIGASGWSTMTLPLWLGALHTSLGAAGIAQVTYYAALGRLGVGRTVVVMFLVPVVALVTAVSLLDERVSPLQGAGAAMVLFGIWLVRRGASRAAGSRATSTDVT